jgi:alanine-glyoxylate transaminase/serine-glyoxylate transaminase/serine-pyruvate transaminase
LEKRFARHRANHEALKSALDVMGLKILSQEGHQLWQLNAVEVPAGVDEAAVGKRLLTEHGIEVGAGLGPMKGKIWRVGLMGETSNREHVRRFVEAFGELLAEAGHKNDTPGAVRAVG